VLRVLVFPVFALRVLTFLLLWLLRVLAHLVIALPAMVVVRPLLQLPCWERALRVLAFLLFVLLVLDLAIPLLAFSDSQWANAQLVTPLFIVGQVLQLALLILAPALMVRSLRRSPDTWHIAWELWSGRLFLVSIGGILAFYAWWVLLQLSAGPYAGPTYLPVQARPLGIVICALPCVAMMGMIVEVVWRAMQAKRAAHPEG
jgi:hypothetical protein